jgi:hypothetical protein
MLVDWCRNLRKKWGFTELRSRKNSRPISRRPVQRCRPPLEIEQLECRVVPTTISGVVFEDFNASGKYVTAATINADQSGTVGVAVDTAVAGVTVSAYDSNGNLVGTTVSTTTGYTLVTSDPGNGPYRLQFTNLPTGYVEGPLTVASSATFATDSHGAVQFVAAGGAAGNVFNFGIILPAEEQSIITSTSNLAGGGTVNSPDLLTSEAVVGNYNGANATGIAITDIPYAAGAASTAGTDAAYADAGASGQHVAIPESQVGTTYGLAFDGLAASPGAAGTIYASAFDKMFAGFGPSGLNGGTGAIYMNNTNYTPTGAAVTTATLFADLNALFAPTVTSGAGTATFTNGSANVTGIGTSFTKFFLPGQSIRLDSNGTFFQIQSITDDTHLILNANWVGTTGTGAYSRQVPDAGGNPHNTTGSQNDTDPQVWDTIGKTSLGGIGLSADGKTLYVLDLSNRTLYALGINPATGAFNGTVYGTQIPGINTVGAGSWTTTVTGTGTPGNDPNLGDLRPFALQVYNGKIYIGVVNSAESTVPTVNTLTITAISEGTGVNANLVTVTTAANTFQTGDTVHIAGVTTAGFDGIFTITRVSGTQFTYTDATTGLGTGGLNGANTTATDMGNRNDMVAYVFTATDTGSALNFAANPVNLTQVGAPAGQDWISLNYSRGTGDGGVGHGDLGTWNPWTPTQDTIERGGGQNGSGEYYPQAMLTGIAFDAQGNMVLGFRDRTGDETDVNGAVPGGPFQHAGAYAVSGGDTLRAGLNATTNTWVLENNGSITAVSASGSSQVITSTHPDESSSPQFTITGTGATRVGTLVTITTTTANNFSVGQSVVIAGVGTAAYNGTYTITAVLSTTQFQYVDANAPGANSGNGTAQNQFSEGAQGPGTTGPFYWQQ